MKNLALILFGAILFASIQSTFAELLDAEQYRDEELKILRDQRREERRNNRENRDLEREYCLQSCREECRR